MLSLIRVGEMMSAFIAAHPPDDTARRAVDNIVDFLQYMALLSC